MFRKMPSSLDYAVGLVCGLAILAGWVSLAILAMHNLPIEHRYAYLSIMATLLVFRDSK